MCRHRVPGRWWQFWAWFTATVLTVFSVAETIGLTTEGEEATYSHFWWCVTGQVEPCRHSTTGRIGIVAVCVWVAAHLGWGKWGLEAFLLWIRKFRARLSSTPRRDHVR